MDSNKEQISTAYIELGKLLQKKRSAEKSAQVSSILESNFEIEDKVIKIQKVDSEDTSNESSKPEAEEEFVDIILPVREQEDYESLLKKENILTPTAAKKSINKIKIEFFRSGFFHFYFRDYNKIKNFNNKANVLRYRSIPPQVKMANGTMKIFSKSIIKDCMELLKCHELVLKVGWIDLRKMEYNLICQFNELIKKILNINFGLINSNDVNMLDKLRDLEKKFIICHYKQNYQDIIISSISSILAKHPEWKIDSIHISNLINGILNQNARHPSIYNFILGMNMVKYRRYMKFKDLFSSDLDNIINNYEFECDGTIKREIKEYINNTLTELLNLLKQKKEIDKLQRFLPKDDNVYDFSKLEYFYEKANENSKLKFSKDTENVVVFVLTFYETFLRIYEMYLYDQIAIETYEVVKIFNYDYFQLEIGKIKFLLEKLEKFKYSSPILSMDRYLELIKTSDASSGTEIEIMQLIKELVSLSQAIANKLIEIEKYHDPQLTHGNGSQYKPLEPAMLVSKSLIIPYWNKKIQSDDIIHGQSVLNILSDIISICILIGIFLHDTNIDMILNKRDKVNAEIKKKIETLKRVANPIQFKKINEKYNIDPTAGFYPS